MFKELDAESKSTNSFAGPLLERIKREKAMSNEEKLKVVFLPVAKPEQAGRTTEKPEVVFLPVANQTKLAAAKGIMQTPKKETLPYWPSGPIKTATMPYQTTERVKLLPLAATQETEQARRGFDAQGRNNGFGAEQGNTPAMLPGALGQSITTFAGPQVLQMLPGPYGSLWAKGTPALPMRGAQDGKTIDNPGKNGILAGRGTESVGENATPYLWEDANKGILLLGAKAHGKEAWKGNPNKRKGSEERQKSGDRERNVGHPEGEEHSRVPKGSGGKAKGSNGPLRVDTLDGIGQAILGGVAAAGAGYLIYRGIRILPSLLPPLWWTIPVNFAVP